MKKEINGKNISDLSILKYVKVAHVYHETFLQETVTRASNMKYYILELICSIIIGAIVYSIVQNTILTIVIVLITLLFMIFLTSNHQFEIFEKLSEFTKNIFYQYKNW